MEKEGEEVGEGTDKAEKVNKQSRQRTTRNRKEQ